MRKDKLLEELKRLRKFKKSKEYYASRLSINVEEVNSLLKELSKNTQETTNFYHVEGTEIPSYETTFTNNLDKGTAVYTSITTSSRTLDELLRDHKVDKKLYKVSSYWSKQKGDKFYHSLFLTLIKPESEEKFQESFIDFLKEFKPSGKTVRKELNSPCKDNISLILPKQDAHYNKYDIGGDNSIQERFEREKQSTLSMLSKASSCNYIEEVVYIIGSDQFNSEWTDLTTKGTPQLNILPYQESFSLICNHEIEMVQNIRSYAKRVKVLFVAGNHDEFVGWHLIHFLESYFRGNDDISFDSSTINTKYHRYGNSAIMLNHGDAIKPKELAHKFPIGFKNEWSECDNYYIFTGDKHVELSLDIHGIKFYQVPQLSTAKSKWDDKQGYIDSKAEMTAFVITKDKGMSDIYKNLI